MPSSGGPSPYGWTTSSPSSPKYRLARPGTSVKREGLSCLGLVAAC